MNYILVHAAMLAAIAVALITPGLLWDALFARNRTPDVLRPIALFTTGAATWIVLAFGLCALHQFRRTVVLVLLIALFLGMLAAWWRRPLPLHPVWEREPGWRLLVALPVLVVFGTCFLIALMPRPASDADTYHLTIPKLFVAAQGFRRLPYNVYSNWPLNTELLFGLVLLFHDYVSATLVHFGFGVLTSLALVLGGSLVRTRHPRLTGWLAVAFFWMSGIIRLELCSAFVDLACAFFFLAAFLFLYQALETPESNPRNLMLAGLSAGVLAGCKLNGVLAAACVATLYLIQFLQPVRVRIPLRSWFLWFWLPALLLAIVWPLKAWVLTGDPVYPFLHSTFGGPEWSEQLTDQFKSWQAGIGMGRSALDYLLLPGRVFLYSGAGYDHFGGDLSPVWIALVPLTVLLGWRQRFVRACLGVAGLYFVVWALSSQQTRFLIPTIALLALAGGVALAGALERAALPTRRLALPAAAAVSGALLLLSSSTMFPAAREWFQLYAKNGPALPDGTIPDMYRYINAKLPRSARLLLLYTNRGFYLNRDYIADSFLEASQISDWLSSATTVEETHRKLREAGVTHILVQESSQEIPYPPGLVAMFSELRGIQRVFHDDHTRQWLFAVCESPSCSQPVAAQH